MKERKKEKGREREKQNLKCSDRGRSAEAGHLSGVHKNHHSISTSQQNQEQLKGFKIYFIIIICMCLPVCMVVQVSTGA